MSARDQPFSDRASAFWGHHRLLVEQLAGISGQRQLSFQRSDAFVGGGQLVGLHTGHALHNAGIDERLALPPKQGGLTDPGIDRDRCDRFTQSQPRNDLPAHRRRIHTGHVTS